MIRSKLLLSFIVLAGGSAAFGHQATPQDVDYTSRFDLSGGYNLIDANAPPSSCQCFTMNGAFVEGDYNFRSWLGVAGMVTGGHAKDISELGQNLTLLTYLGGPRIMWNHQRLSLFGEFLVGGGRGTGSYFPTSAGSKSSATALAFSTGGGLDFNITPRFAIRAFNAQYLRTEFPNGANDTQNQLQISTGVVFRFGGRGSGQNAAPVMRVPEEHSEIEFTCSVGTQEVAAGGTVQVIGETMTLPDKLDVNYSWTTNAGTVQGSGRMVMIDTTHLAPGTYRVDGRASLASNPSVSSTCQTSFRVREEAAQASSNGQETVIPPTNDLDDFHKNVVDLFFDYDSANIRPEGERGITQDAAYLSSHPDLNITIAGYADERGSAEYNIALGLKRATATRDALVGAGIDRSRMKVLSYGKEKPFCTDDTASCMQQNRRAQLVPDTP
ncbi:OmpA family protein [Silvibacterium sp.]|uniref:OmpA family protein n=1 Tax=Silvibacterium sp. TaxID=1964179 RepID=UPI0039E2F652